MDRILDKKKVMLGAAVVLLVLLIAVDVSAQCPMCRMAAESNLENGGTEGRGLNKGILYILSLPYLLISVIGFIWWKNRRQGQIVD